MTSATSTFYPEYSPALQVGHAVLAASRHQPLEWFKSLSPSHFSKLQSWRIASPTCSQLLLLPPRTPSTTFDYSSGIQVPGQSFLQKSLFSFSTEIQFSLCSSHSPISLSNHPVRLVLSASPRGCLPCFCHCHPPHKQACAGLEVSYSHIYYPLQFIAICKSLNSFKNWNLM